MRELYIDDNDITISRAWDEISLKIENSVDNLTINMTENEAKEFLHALQEIIQEEQRACCKCCISNMRYKGIALS